MNNTAPLAVAVCLLAAPASLAEDPAAARVVELADGALAFDAPADWESVEPGNRILEHELRVEAPEGSDAAPARLTIMAAMGSLDANLARWVGQFQGTEGGAARDGSQTEKFDAGGMPVTLLDISGTYMESAGGPFGPKTPRPGYRLVGAIVETGGAGNYFFKLIGPEETVAPAADAFRELLASLRKK